MKRYKQDWVGGTTRNFRMSWLRFVRRLINRALFLYPTFDAPCSRFFTLTLFTEKSMDRFKYWPSRIIAASRAIGWLGFNDQPDGRGSSPTLGVMRTIHRR